MTLPSTHHLTPLDLDLATAGELAIVERRRIDLHVAACPLCAEAMRSRSRAESDFVRGLLPRTLPGMLAKRRRASWTRWLRGSLVLGGAAAASAFLYLAVPHRGGGTGARERDVAALLGGDAIKGEPSLHLFAKRDGRPFPVAPGSRLRAGDAIRFVLDPPGATYVLIASVDGAGGISIYYPYRGEASVRVDPGRRLEVPDSITLDAASGPERIFAFLSNAPLSVEQVRKALAPVARGGAETIRDTRRVGGLQARQITLLFDKDP